jgi:hypothetical protein
MQMPIIQTCAVIESHTSEAVFPVEVPYDNRGWDAKLTAIWGSHLPGDINFGLRVSREHGANNFYTYTLKNIYRDRTTPVTGQILWTRLHAHGKHTEAAFAPMTSYPRVFYDTGDTFNVRLPPDTALFTTDPLFFRHALQFSEKDLSSGELVLPGDTSGKTTPVFGFWNTDKREWTLRAREEMPKGALIADEVPDEVTTPPATTVVYATVSDSRLTYEAKYPSTPDKAREALAIMVSRSLKYLSLPEDAVTVQLAGDGEVSLASKAVKDSKITLRLTLRGDTASYLDGPLESVFGMAAGLAPVLYATPKLGEDDPLTNHYALTLLAPGTVGAASYVFGESQQETLAFVRDPHTVLYAARVKLGRRPFRVVFHDKNFDPLSMPTRCKVSLNFDLLSPQ